MFIIEVYASLLKISKISLNLSAKKIILSEAASSSWDLLKLLERRISNDGANFLCKVIYCLPNQVFPKLVYFRKLRFILIFSSFLNFNFTTFNNPFICSFCHNSNTLMVYVLKCYIFSGLICKNSYNGSKQVISLLK